METLGLSGPDDGAISCIWVPAVDKSLAYVTDPGITQM